MSSTDKTGWSDKALMTVTDADLVEAVLAIRSRATEGRLDVVEWGAGKSTRYFTSLLGRQTAPFRWLSIEYDRRFYESDLARWVDEQPDARGHLVGSGRVELGESDGSIDVVVFDHGEVRPYRADRVADRAVNMDGYVGFPAGVGRSFDVAIVDGRKRRRCVLQSLALTTDDGVCLLHDAERAWYRCAMDAFPTGRRIGDMLWIGTRGDPASLDRLIDDVG